MSGSDATGEVGSTARRLDAISRRLDGFEDRLDEMEADIEDMQNSLAQQSELRVSFGQVAEALTDEDVDFSAHGPELSRTIADVLAEKHREIDQLRQTLDSLTEGGASNQDEAWIQIVQEARRLKGNPDHQAMGDGKILLYTGDIVNATEYSDRWAQRLIEEYGEKKDAADWRPYERPSAENDNQARQKRLVVDLTAVPDEL